MTTARVTQEIVEALVAPTSTARVSQEIVEALVAPTPTARVTLIVVEALLPFAAVTAAAPQRVIWF